MEAEAPSRATPADGSLTAAGISVRFEGLFALAGVHCALGRGEILGLIGPNGAGKTTLINVLTGFQRPDAGRVVMDDEDITGWPTHRIARRGVARSFQSGRLFRELPVRENLEVTAIGVGAGRREARRRATEILEWLGLPEKAEARADSLPFGHERRVGIARALAMHPTYLLLDEPAAGLNEAECDDLVRTVARIPRRFGCGVLLIEHNMRVIMNACGRIHVIDTGSTLAEGTPAEIQGNPDVIRAYLGTRTERRRRARGR